MISDVIQPSQISRLKSPFVCLPRLLYVGDVAVEASVAGSTLLYRLLEDYPAERLLIAEGNMWKSRPEKRLADVRYESFQVGAERVLRTRLHVYYSSILQLTASFRTKLLKRIVEEFRPEAILTVAHGYSWLTAARLAKKLALPLHLIVHDDWVSIQESVLPGGIYKSLKQKFGETYRQATSRNCASPYMVEDFVARYAAQGTILYPSRAADVPIYEHAPCMRRVSRKLTFAFAGTVNTRGYAESLATFARVLDAAGGALIVYSNLGPADVKACGLTGSHVTVQPIQPVNDLVASLRQLVDVLFVPMSFAEEDAHNMRLAFPSKLADYSITGLPLLIWGPSYCSAIRWARENAGVAEVVDDPGAESLGAAVTKLMKNAHYRRALGEAALIKGQEFFSHEAAVQRFYQML
jgi:hypothetical protein